ncbi:hypothetical protein [Blastococcus brunescens]|uniref:TetR family transcriptional regulator n=1 Tax=Blastococcus brunescens TaxID=1564165 RepID=A0ABZ1B9U2_9ACTN|nr:hypothetical protein [Blastococcus sp. BMG 8361]WRL65890.1 hypothetical protein U6N30_10225 [Blastococcus sp. BMG 8361]
MHTSGTAHPPAVPSPLPAGRRDAPITLAEAAVKTLGLVDALGLWGRSGVRSEAVR